MRTIHAVSSHHCCRCDFICAHCAVCTAHPRAESGHVCNHDLALWIDAPWRDDHCRWHCLSHEPGFYAFAPPLNQSIVSRARYRDDFYACTSFDVGIATPRDRPCTRIFIFCPRPSGCRFGQRERLNSFLACTLGIDRNVVPQHLAQDFFRFGREPVTLVAWRGRVVVHIGDNIFDREPRDRVGECVV